jgi:hypothetical protein
MVPKPEETYTKVKADLEATVEAAKAEATERMPLKDQKLSELEETTKSMLFLGSLIYTLAKLAHVAKQFGLREALPDEAKELLFGNYNIKETKLKVGDELLPVSASTVEKMIEAVEQFNQACGFKIDVLGLMSLRKRFGESHRVDSGQFAFLNNFDAEFNSRELVYGITVSKASNSQGRITVAFRGSVELNDWLHNITIPFEVINLRIDEKSRKAWLIEGAHFTSIQIDVKIARDLKVLLGEEPIRVHKGFLSKNLRQKLMCFQ